MTSAEDYSKVAEAAYEADPSWKSPPISKGRKFPAGDGTSEFQVVSDPVSDPVTGFQAIAVAPVVNGRPDFSRVSIAYAGTNPGDHPDISADAQIVVGGQIAAGTQAAHALAYAKQVMAEILRKHPGAGFETVGHSLGGYLAEYVSGKLHVPSTTFNGPDAWDSLSDEDKEWYLAEVAAGREPWSRYVNEWDLIGNYLGDPSGSANYVTGEPGQDLITNHNIATGFGWNPDGSVKGAGAKGRSLTEISDNLLSWVPDDMRPGMATAVAGMVGVLRNPAVASVVGGVVSGVTVLMDTMAVGSMATNILQLETPLQSIKTANSALIPLMERGLADAQNAVMVIPSITMADINNCVTTHRLNVHQNIDKDAVDAVNKRVDEHILLVHQLVAGIGVAAQNALAQDAQWAHIYAGQ